MSGPQAIPNSHQEGEGVDGGVQTIGNPRLHCHGSSLLSLTIPSRGEHAAVFQNGEVRDLGTFDASGSWSTASAINDSGRILGTSTLQVPFNGDPRVMVTALHPFTYDLPNGPMTDLSPDGACNGLALNGAGDVAGYCFAGTRICNHNGPCPPFTHAALWRGGSWIDLNDAIDDASWVLETAGAMNDQGQIAGVGMQGGVQRAFVLTPRAVP
jgi:uncharacterized membrane protein